MKRLPVIAALAAAAILAGSGPAAADDWSVGLYTVVRAPAGSVTLLGSWDVPADLVGRDCTATSTPENNPSIHPGNDLLLVSDSTVTLADVESGAPVSSRNDEVLLGSTVAVSLVMGPDRVYSAGIEISFDCSPDRPSVSTTTTTVPATSTTLPASTTSTTGPPPSTSVPATTTTTTVPGSSVPPDSSTTTVPASTVPPDSSTTTVCGSICGGGTVTSVPVRGSTTVAPPGTLPVTGDSLPSLPFAATLALASGALALLFARRTA